MRLVIVVHAKLARKKAEVALLNPSSVLMMNQTDRTDRSLLDENERLRTRYQARVSGNRHPL